MKCSNDEVERNAKSIINAFDAEEMAIMEQVHGTTISYVDKGAIPIIIKASDGIITDKKKLVLCVQTADCVPVLFSSESGDLIGAVHAGWKGAKNGIIHNVIKQMRAKTNEEIYAIIGPSIHQMSYEVDEKYRENFMSEDSKNIVFFQSVENKDGYFLFDLPSYVKNKLHQVGVTNVTHCDEDTYSNPDKYYSYRRSCHTGKGYEGSLLSAIVINK